MFVVLDLERVAFKRQSCTRDEGQVKVEMINAIAFSSSVHWFHSDSGWLFPRAYVLVFKDLLHGIFEINLPPPEKQPAFSDF